MFRIYLFERAAIFGRSFLLVLSELENKCKKRLKKHYKNVVELKNIVIFVMSSNGARHKKIEIMRYEDQIENLKNKLDSVRSNKDFEIISKQILKLAKKYNSLDYRHEYLIIGTNVYGLNLKK